MTNSYTVPNARPRRYQSPEEIEDIIRENTGLKQMTFSEALKRSWRCYAYFSCANGASISFTITKKQIREIAEGCDLKDVYSNDEDQENTATWSFNHKNHTLHIHFQT